VGVVVVVVEGLIAVVETGAVEGDGKMERGTEMKLNLNPRHYQWRAWLD
jgi:hypothetical protein